MQPTNTLFSHLKSRESSVALERIGGSIRLGFFSSKDNQKLAQSNQTKTKQNRIESSQIITQTEHVRKMLYQCEAQS